MFKVKEHSWGQRNIYTATCLEDNCVMTAWWVRKADLFSRGSREAARCKVQVDGTHAVATTLDGNKKYLTSAIHAVFHIYLRRRFNIKIMLSTGHASRGLIFSLVYFRNFSIVLREMRRPRRSVNPVVKYEASSCLWLPLEIENSNGIQYASPLQGSVYICCGAKIKYVGGVVTRGRLFCIDTFRCGAGQFTGGYSFNCIGNTKKTIKLPDEESGNI